MARGGYRPGAGRPLGSKNKRSQMIEEAARRTAAGGPTPLEFLLRVMRDENESMDRRLEAAKAAAPYCHPRLVSQQITENPRGPSFEEWLAILEADGAFDERVPTEAAKVARNQTGCFPVASPI